MKKAILVSLLIYSVFAMAGTRLTRTASWGSGAYTDIAIHDTYAYCAASGSGFDILDISTPENPLYMASVQTFGETYLVATHNNTLIIVDGGNIADDRVSMYDLSDPAHPILQSTIEIEEMIGYMGNVKDLLVTDAHVYFCFDGYPPTDALVICSYDPETGGLELDSSLNLWGYPYALAKQGNLIYVANTTRGIQICDVSDPHHPELLDERETDIEPHQLLLNDTGELLYVACNENFSVYDLSNALEPALLGSCSIHRGWKKDLTKLTSTSLAVSGGDAVTVLRVSNPEEPAGIGDLAQPDGIDDTDSTSGPMEFVSGLLYVTYSFKGLAVISPQVSEDVIAGQLDRSIYADSVYSMPGYVLVPARNEGLLILGNATLDTMTQTAFLPLPADFIRAGWVTDDLLVLMTHYDAYLISVSDPATPQLLHHIEDLNLSSAKSCCILTDCVLFLGNEGIAAFSIVDPASPTFLQLNALESKPTAFSTDGTLLYVTDNDNMLHIMELNGETGGLTTSGSISTGFYSHAIVSENGFVHVSMGSAVNAGIKSFDVSDPMNPMFTGSIRMQEAASDLSTHGNLLAVADHFGGVHLVDISEPYSPQSLSLEYCFGQIMNVDFASDGSILVPGNYFSTIFKLTPKSGALIPHVDWSTEWSSYLIADNTSEQPIEMDLTLYESAVPQIQTITVEPGEALQIPLETGSCGEVSYEGSGLYLKESFVNNRQQGIAEFELTGAVYSQLEFVLPHYLSDKLTWMGLALFNPNDYDVPAVMEAYVEDGSLLDTQPVEIPSHTRLVGYVSTFFPSLDYADVSRVTVTAEGSLCGINISGQENAKLLFTPASRNHSAYYAIIPHIANQWDYWNNRIILDNVSVYSSEITLHLYRDGTEQIRESFVLPGQQTMEVDLNAYSAQDVQCGYVEIWPDSVVARQSFEYKDTDGTAEFLLNWRVGSKLVFNFPSYAQEELSWNGLAIHNVTGEPDTVTFTAYRNGIEVGQTTMSIPAEDRRAVLLPDLFPDAAEGGIDRVIAEGNQLLTGINISGAGQERYLFTPAFPMTE